MSILGGSFNFRLWMLLVPELNAFPVVIGSRASQLLQKILHPATSSLESSSCIEGEDRIPSSAILSLLVDDPRLLNNDINNALEAKAQKDMKLLPCSSLGPDRSVGLSEGFDLWDAGKDIDLPIEENILFMEKHRQQMELLRIGDMNSSREQTSSEGQFSRFCTILLLKSASQKTSTIRWSIILPLCWIKVFWVSLVSNGAQAIGLSEKHWIACELGLPCFPREFPDCNAYSCFMALEESVYDKKYELLSPLTRTWKVPVSSPWDSIRVALEELIGTGHVRIDDMNIEMNKPYLRRCKTESESI